LQILVQQNFARVGHLPHSRRDETAGFDVAQTERAELPDEARFLRSVEQDSLVLQAIPRRDFDDPDAPPKGVLTLGMG
jgi:hypothetical protein